MNNLKSKDGGICDDCGGEITTSFDWQGETEGIGYNLMTEICLDCGRSNQELVRE